MCTMGVLALKKMKKKTTEKFVFECTFKTTEIRTRERDMTLLLRYLSFHQNKNAII